MVTGAVGYDPQLLASVRAGMAVYDRYGDKVGNVRQVYLGEGPASAATSVDDLLLGHIPEALRPSFATDGVVEIQTGLLQGSCFVAGKEVHLVRDAEVWLATCLDHLARR